jgi:peptide/nickel transport system ATP-binding protein
MAKSDDAVLSISGLTVDFSTPDGIIHAVRNIGFEVARGECVGIVGESGSGKSQTVMAAMGLIAGNGTVSGEIRFQGENLVGMKPKQLNTIRGERIGMIFQDPLTSLTPHMTIGAQMREVLRRHRGMSGKAAEARCVEWLERVRIPEAARRLNQFPHELSGGMRQRVVIAMAMLCEPELLIADEPTTALDVTVQAQVLELMDDLKKETGTSIVLITHDMGVVARMSDRVVVIRKGEIVERGNVDDIFYNPSHEYTRMLLEAMPRIDDPDRGGRPMPIPAPSGQIEPFLKVNDLEVQFPVSVTGGLFPRRKPLRAVDGVSFDLKPGETLGIVGESGCGKSTLARAVLRLVDPKAGSIAWFGRDIAKETKGQIREIRQDLQVVFQDPMASLDPRMTIGRSIAEPLSVFRPELNGKERETMARDIMAKVGLDPDLINRYPHELSGGQNQRVGVARAMILNPKLVICDEAVSALDVSVQAQIIDLLISLQRELGLSLLFISHDLSVVREISHRVMVLYLGRVVEIADRDAIYEDARHPYTKALISAVPSPDPRIERSRERIRLKGDLPSPLDTRAALRFLKSRVVDDPDVAQYRPVLVEVAPDHFVAEHDASELSADLHA